MQRLLKKARWYDRSYAHLEWRCAIDKRSAEWQNRAIHGLVEAL